MKKLSIKAVQEEIAEFKKEFNPIMDLVSFRYKPFDPFEDLVREHIRSDQNPRFSGTFFGIDIYKDSDHKEGVVSLMYKGEIVKQFEI